MTTFWVRVNLFLKWGIQVMILSTLSRVSTKLCILGIFNNCLKANSSENDWGSRRRAIKDRCTNLHVARQSWRMTDGGIARESTKG